MTRIKTNIPAMTAQKTMARANASLNRTMVRLSTGLRINEGRDDPAGLIAANLIQSDVSATTQAIANTERGNLAIQTADSYLSKVTERLNDMRRLINEAANSVAMSDEQIQADQLVMDASIAAIERIAKTASFQGSKLFDGSMGYSLDDDTSGNFTNLTDINIQSARLDPYYGREIHVAVTDAAEQAEILFNAAPAPLRNIGGEAFTPIETIEWASEIAFDVGDPLQTQFPVEMKFSEPFESHDPEPLYTVEWAYADATGNIDLHAYGFNQAYGGALTGHVSPGEFEIFIEEDDRIVYDTDPTGYGAKILTPNFTPQLDRKIVIAYNNRGENVPVDFDTLLQRLQSEINDKIDDGLLEEGTVVEYLKGSAQDYMIPGSFLPAVDATLFGSAAATPAAAAGTPQPFVYDATGNVTSGSFVLGLGGDEVTYSIGGDINIAGASPGSIQVNFVSDPTLTAGEYEVTDTGSAGDIYNVTVGYNNATACEINTQELASRLQDAIQISGGTANSITLTPSRNITYESQSNVAAATSTNIYPFLPVSSYGGENRLSADPYITGGGTANIGLGHAVKFDGQVFSTGNDANGDIVFRKVTGDEFEVELQVVSPDSGYEEGVEAYNNRFTVTLFSNTLSDNDTVRGISEEVQRVIANSSYKETLYCTWENLTGDYLVPMRGTTGLETTIPNKTVSDKSQIDYLTVSAIGKSEHANNIAVALTFGTEDRVGYDAVINKLTVTLSDSPDWDRRSDPTTGDPGGLTAQLRSLGEINGVDFSAGTFQYLSDTFTDMTLPAPTPPTRLQPPDGEHLGITNRRNYETEGSTGISGGFTLRESVSFEVRGEFGMEVVSLGKGATRKEIVDAFNTISESTGVTAEIEDTDQNGDGNTDFYRIKLQALSYGSDKDITINVLQDKGYFDLNLDKHFDAGKDATGTINGIQAVAQGNLLISSTNTLQAEIRVEAGTAEASSFFIRPGGGALFQLGPEVISSQQKNLSMGSLSSGVLGNAEVGYLYELKTGGSADLRSNTERAARIIKTAIAQVSQLSGRLGAFQAMEIETNIWSLTDNVVNMKDSESIYRDADYAYESSQLAKDQVLTQANTSVLSMANQQSQQVLALIRQ